MKNVVYAIIITACVGLAVVVFMLTRPGKTGGTNSVTNAKQVWIKCRSCNQVDQMGEKDYYEALSEKSKASAAAMMFTPPLTCRKCGKNSAGLAEKCANPTCGEIFFTGSIPGDMSDRCPKCKHSAVEDSRKARLNQRQQQ